MSNKILKFSASWCGPCKSMAAVLKRITLPVAVHEIDVDDDHEQAAQYAIRGVPTLVLVDPAGKEVSRLVGSKNEAEIKNWIGQYA